VETQYVCADGAGHASSGGRARFEQAGIPCARKNIALRITSNPSFKQKEAGLRW
jgi:hypothetical protein